MLNRFRKKLTQHLIAVTACTAITISSHAAVETAGTLLVDLQVGNLGGTSNGSVWNNAGTLGNFSLEQGDVAIQSFGSAFGVLFDEADAFRGPLADASITGNGTRTVEVWSYQPDPSFGGLETLVAWGHRGGPSGSNVAFSHGSNGTFGAVGHWGAPDIGWNGTPPAGEWRHLAYTYDGTNINVYDNGTLKNSETFNLVTHGGTTINLGAQNADALGTLNAGERLTGAIGTVRVHSEALTESQIMNNFLEEATAFGATVPPPPPTPQQADLVGLYRFDNANMIGQDYSANQNHLTAQGDASQGTGISGGSLALDGVGDMLTSPDGLPTNLPIGADQYSISAWVKADATGPQGIVGWGNYGEPGRVNALRIFGDNGLRHYWWGNDLDALDVAPNADLDNGEWAHVTAIFDSMQRKIYVNGVLVIADSPGDPNTGENNTFAIGRTCDFCGDGEFFNGELEDVAIFSGALSEAEIAAIMSGDYNGFASIPEPASFSILALSSLALLRRRK